MFTLSISKSCHEAWSDFTPTQQGGFCSSCQKEVVDFTAMSNLQISLYFENKPLHVCGRFRHDQLRPNALKNMLALQPSIATFRAGLLSVLMLVSVNSLLAQPGNSNLGASSSMLPIGITQSNDLIIKGRVISSEDGSALPGVNVYLKNSQVGIATDADGQFEFPQKLKTGDVLVFSFIGFVTKEIIVEDQITNLNIAMEFDSFITLGEVTVDEPYVAKQPKGLRKLFRMTRVRS